MNRKRRGRWMLRLSIIGFIIYSAISVITDKPPKEEPITWEHWDLVNGRPIYAEDTNELCQHPYSKNEWVTKEAADSIRNRKYDAPKIGKGNKKTKASKANEQDIESSVESYLNNNLD